VRRIPALTRPAWRAEQIRMRLLLAVLSIALALVGCDAGPDAGGPAWAGRATSQGGSHRVAVRPRDASAPRGELHEWIVRVERTDGEPVRLRLVQFDGGMPAHRHGFVTTPRVTRELGGGEFLVEGVKFHMPGDWELRVTWIGPEGTDGAILPISVAP
jgi:hypothetical protein